MGLRILVADDDIDICTLVATVLRRQGHLVDTAADGQQALLFAITQPPDVAVLDLMMPKLDGYRLTQALRADHRTCDVPVVVLTARAGGIDRRYAFDVGAKAFLRKPFDKTDLLEAIRAATMRSA